MEAQQIPKLIEEIRPTNSGNYQIESSRYVSEDSILGGEVRNNV